MEKSLIENEDHFADIFQKLEEFDAPIGEANDVMEKVKFLTREVDPGFWVILDDSSVEEVRQELIDLNDSSFVHSPDFEGFFITVSDVLMGSDLP